MGETKYLYTSLSTQTKDILKNVIKKFSIEENNHIEITPSLLEKIFSKIIDSFEDNTSCINFGDNNKSFDTLINKGNETFAISLKLKIENSLYAKLYEMPGVMQEIKDLDKNSLACVHTIIDYYNNRIIKENKDFNINYRNTIYMEKSKNKITIKQGVQGIIDKELIKEVKFLNKKFSFIFNDETFEFDFKNHTLLESRRNYQLVDIYEYQDGEILSVENILNKFILEEKKNKKNKEEEKVEKVEINKSMVDITYKEIEKKVNDIKILTEEEMLFILGSEVLRSTPNFYKVVATPKFAKNVVEKHMSSNRTPKQKKIKEYATSMIEKKWEGNQGDTISFDIDGKLSDGQHRLFSLASLDGQDIEVPFLICTATERSPYKDIGVKRTMYDTVTYTELCPVEYRQYFTSNMNAAINILMHFFGDGKRDSATQKMNYLEYFFKNNVELLKGFREPWEIDNGGKKVISESIESCFILRKAPILASLFNLFALNVITRDDLKYIVYTMNTGKFKGTQDEPLRLLREYLKDSKNIPGGDKGSSLLFRKVDDCIRAYKTGTKPTTCRKNQYGELSNNQKKLESSKFPNIYNFGGHTKNKNVVVEKIMEE